MRKQGGKRFRHEGQKQPKAAIKSWAHPCITGYEVKVDRQDFLRVKTQLQKGVPANILNNIQIAADAIQRVLHEFPKRL